jgi:hypothetical protein
MVTVRPPPMSTPGYSIRFEPVLVRGMLGLTWLVGTCRESLMSPRCRILFRTGRFVADGR